MELLATGRMAEVYAYDERRVVKLDRPEWNGIAALEMAILSRLAAVGVPVPRADEVTTIDGRSGIVMERVDGPSLLETLPTATPAEVRATAGRFVELQAQLVGTELQGLDLLVPRLANELATGGLPSGLRDELATLLHDLDDRRQCLCHFDFHPGNVLLGPNGWVVIDWLTVATGPPVADVMRTALTLGQATSGPPGEFLREVWRLGMARHQVDEDTATAWLRVLAGARLAEGFAGADAAWLREVASGTRRLSL